MTTWDLNTFILHGLFAAIGGLVRVLNGTPGKKYSLIDYISGAFVGVFAGLVIYFICKSIGLSEYLTVAATGLGGYMGTPILDVLANVMKWRIVKETGGGNDVEK